MKTRNVRDGYDKNGSWLGVRTMTVEEAKLLQSGSHALVVANDGTARRVKVNGKPRTWKRNPGRVEVPIKYGLYEHGVATDDGNGGMTYLVVEV